MKLKNNTPYMIRNDGKVFEIKEIHPYIIYNLNDNFSEIIDNVIYSHPEWLKWFYRNTLQEITRKKVIQCIQYLSNILLFNELSDDDEFSELGKLSYMQDLLKYFNITPKSISKVTESTIITLRELFRELNNLTNQEFLRMRTGGEYWEEDSEEIYFRISSSDFNWFNIIWNLIYDNRNWIENITIESDKQAGKDIGKNFYVINGKAIDHMPIEDFINLRGNPVIEDLDDSDERIIKLKAGKSLIEAFGDFGPFHNNSKFETRRRIYIRETFASNRDKKFMNVYQLLRELNIDKRGSYSEDNTYVIDLSGSNEFGRINSILDRNDLLELIDESSYVTENNANLDYRYQDQYLLSLIADFENDYYQLVIVEMED